MAKKSANSNASAAREALKSAFERGDYAQAESLARSMTAKRPADAFAWNRLGIALLLGGRTEEAIAPTRKSLELLPRDAETHNNLGVMLDHLGRKQEAAQSFRRAVEIEPCYAEACNNLGNVLIATGESTEAEFWLKKAISLKPGYVEARNNLGALYSMLGRHEEAADYFRRAIAQNPNHAEAHSNLGNTLRDLGRHEDAKRCLEKALSLRPDYPDALNSLGVVHFELGNPERAAECHLKAVVLRPDYAQCHYNLAMVSKADDARIDALRTLLETVRDDYSRTYYSFSLARACEDTGRMDEAFDFLAEGNRLKKRQIGYHIESDRQRFEEIRHAFGKIPEIPPLPMPGATPILIVGMPRSGTTLVEQILSSHAEVHGAGELDILERLCESNFVKSAHPDLEETCRIITSLYLESLDSHGKRFVTDKMPLNFLWLGFLLAATPEIRVVHVKRDPVATCFSNFKQLFANKGNGFSHDLSDLAQYYRLYEDLMEFWKEHFPGRIHELNYERLTENQEEETRNLLEYCGLDWDENCMEFENTGRAVQTASAAQVRNKMYRGSSQAWRKYEKHLAPLLEELGRK